MIRTRRAALAQSVQRFSEKIMLNQKTKSAMTIQSNLIALLGPMLCGAR